MVTGRTLIKKQTNKKQNKKTLSAGVDTNIVIDIIFFVIFLGVNRRQRVSSPIN